jgi:hypothetical protein
MQALAMCNAATPNHAIERTVVGKLRTAITA